MKIQKNGFIVSDDKTSLQMDRVHNFLSKEAYWCLGIPKNILAKAIESSLCFGVYVEKFARYNELYGSIGTLLVMMFYVWLNCILVLLGFELNAFIFQLKSTTKENNS